MKSSRNVRKSTPYSSIAVRFSSATVTSSITWRSAKSATNSVCTSGSPFSLLHTSSVVSPTRGSGVSVRPVATPASVSSVLRFDCLFRWERWEWARVQHHRARSEHDDVREVRVAERHPHHRSVELQDAALPARQPHRLAGAEPGHGTRDRRGAVVRRHELALDGLGHGVPLAEAADHLVEVLVDGAHLRAAPGEQHAQPDASERPPAPHPPPPHVHVP